MIFIISVNISGTIDLFFILASSMRNLTLLWNGITIFSRHFGIAIVPTYWHSWRNIVHTFCKHTVVVAMVANQLLMCSYCTIKHNCNNYVYSRNFYSNYVYFGTCLSLCDLTKLKYYFMHITLQNYSVCKKCIYIFLI